ncbi:MAG TPA: hypothetical protein VF331_15515 [Polyangiales bacterium]
MDERGATERDVVNACTKATQCKAAAEPDRWKITGPDRWKITGTTAPFTLEQTRVLIELAGAWSDRKLVVIGAAALGCHGSMTWRRTNDIDLTVVADIPSTQADLRRLGFRRHEKQEHRWFSTTGVALDIHVIERTHAH